MKSESRASRLRMLLRDRFSAGRVVLCPGVHDCLSAKLVEHVGFEHFNVAGAGPTAAWAGEPELGVVTMTEMWYAAYRMLNTVTIPGKVAAAQGGNALNLIRAVREYERAGAAMIQLEDQTSGHYSGFIPGKQVVSTEEMVGKIRAARYARVDEDVLIAVRCDAKLAANGGLEEMFTRCQAYVDAGAEVLMPHGIGDDLEEWKRVAEKLRPLGVPLIANLNAALLFTPKGQETRPFPTAQQLEDMGWTILSYVNHLTHIFMFTGLDYLTELKETGDVSEWRDRVIDFGKRNEIFGLPRWRACEEEFVPTELRSGAVASARKQDQYVYRELDSELQSLREELEARGI